MDIKDILKNEEPALHKEIQQVNSRVCNFAKEEIPCGTRRALIFAQCDSFCLIYNARVSLSR